MAEKTSYTSNQLAQRDQRVQETHAKELDVYRAKNERLRRNFDNSEKLRFCEQQRANQIATLLGYGDAQQAIFDLEDQAADGLSLRDFKMRAHDAQELLEKEKQEAERLRVRLHEVEQEFKQLKAEKGELEAKYDALVIVKERCAEVYKKSYKKWAQVNIWLFGNDNDAPQKMKKRSSSLEFKRQAMRDYKHNASLLDTPDAIQPPAIPSFNHTADKENENTSMPPLKKQRVSANTPYDSPAINNTHLTSITNMGPPSCSPTVFLDVAPSVQSKTRTPSGSRVPLMFKPIEEVRNVKSEPEEPSLTPCPVGERNVEITTPESPDASQVIPGSSQTEDDSQAFTVLSKSVQHDGRPALFKAPAPPPPAPSSTHRDRNPRDSLHPSLPSRPSFATTSATKQPQSSRKPFLMQEMIPAKAMLETPSSTPRTLFTNMTSTVKGKERAIESETPTPLASRTQAQNGAGDYSVFKGRGRYGKQDEPTINALYTIAPENNNGQGFQYDEVVRRKEDRRKLDGADCECCREYYESIGPLPSRLQQPLWRSPTKSPHRPCLNRQSSSPTLNRTAQLSRSVDRPAHTHAHAANNTGSSSSHKRAEGSRRRHSEIAEHKKAISRHRQNWERAKTPPGYWDIGFPDTQEVGDINEKAREMHKRKKDDVDREAMAENGRYRRR